MKRYAITIALTGALALAACGGGADDKAAANIEAAAEGKADALEDAASNTGGAQEEALEDRAENVRDVGEAAAEQADDKDDARVEGQATNTMNAM